jgi:hypothetical protein
MSDLGVSAFCTFVREGFSHHITLPAETALTI